jgi:hypothetical protein
VYWHGSGNVLRIVHVYTLFPIVIIVLVLQVFYIGEQEDNVDDGGDYGVSYTIVYL